MARKLSDLSRATPAGGCNGTCGTRTPGALGTPAMGVKQLAPTTLRAALDAGTRVEVIDVRSEKERAFCAIRGCKPLTPSYEAYLLRLDRTTPLVFVCYRGRRSQAAAEHFAGLGFTQVFNLRGGVDAWAQEVDPGMRRYR